jgi:RNA polymerase primary sigma factor
MRQLTITQRFTNITSNSLGQYLSDVHAYKVFTPEEEAICAKLASEGDEKAKLELILRNLRFVVSVAKQYANNDIPLEDLINEGNIGLIEAANRYKPERGFKFISYGVWWVRKIIMVYLTDNSRMIRLPANQVDALGKLDKNISKLEQKLGRTATIDDILSEFAEELDLLNIDKETYDKRVSDYEFINMLNNNTMDSLDRDINGEDNKATLLSDTISSDSTSDGNILKKELKNELDKHLEILSPKEHYVITEYFGYNKSKTPKVLESIGEDLNLTRERVRQIKEIALKKLNKRMVNSSLKSLV